MTKVYPYTLTPAEGIAMSQKAIDAYKADPIGYLKGPAIPDKSAVDKMERFPPGHPIAIEAKKRNLTAEEYFKQFKWSDGGGKFNA
jgi:hypothetical protein